jgi:hypothetical protein
MVDGLRHTRQAIFDIITRISPPAAIWLAVLFFCGDIATPFFVRIVIHD